MPADAQCYVVAILFRISLFLERTDISSIAILRANIQLYFVKRVLKTWEKEKGIVRVNVTKRMTAPVCPSAFLMLPTK